ncbi:hypothetical protein PTKIN_Ptkin02bG0077000 [Pterospermum kingtungense]
MEVVISVVAVALLLGLSCGCPFPAIYNFGDSNSNTGSASAAFGRFPPPYGETFFGRPSGRYSDGRLIIDFIADELKLPFLSAYLDAIESNFRHGANFAASGSTTAKSPDFKDRLPRAEEFSKALYVLDIGQNDLSYGLGTTTEEQVKESIPNIISQFAKAIEKLYGEGARVFWIHNTGPVGCFPFFVIDYPPKPENADSTGCIKSYNDVAQEFNKHLKDRISQLRAHLHGLVGPFINCCGHFGDYHVICGKTVAVNGTKIFGASCGEPTKHISWDGVHYSEAANQCVANRILDGSHSDPPVPITKACL